MGTPQLNIKDTETSALVRELAELTGESQTEAVRNSVKERLVRKQHERTLDADQRKADKQKEIEGTWAEIQKIQTEIRKEDIDNMLTDDDLYDERGLPR